MSFEPEADSPATVEKAVREAVAAGRLEDARSLADRYTADPTSEAWLVASMLEDVGLALAAADRYDEAIAAFERALEVGWGLRSTHRG